MQKSLLPMNICMQKPFLPINSMITMQGPLFLPTNISMQRNFHFSGQTSTARNNHVNAAEDDDEYIDIEVNSFSPQSTDFEFQMPSSLNDNKELTMLPADDLFYKGKLLPLLLPPRLQTVQNLLKTTPKGAWKGGFAGTSEYADPTITELRAIAVALRWSWEKGIRDVEIQTDAREAVRWIQGDVQLRGIAWDLVTEVAYWCAKEWKVSIRDVYREQNRSADALAMVGSCQMVAWREFQSCPSECDEVYTSDLVRTTQGRRVRETS
nr:probable membrane-associated kinase regulator 4 [Ipomoea batatas]